MTNFTSHMQAALNQARAAAKRAEVPVGAVVINPQGQIIAQAGNRTRELNDPSAHAEILAIREACRLVGNDRLIGHQIYVTLEPCAMCAAAISLARIEGLYYGASDPKSGGVEQGARVFSRAQSHHKPDVYAGIDEAACADLLRDFFANRR